MWRNARRDWPVWAVAFGTFANGSIEVVAAIRSRYPGGRFTAVLPFGFVLLNRTAAVVLGFALVYLSLYLFRRRRLAFWLAVCALGALVVLHAALQRHLYLAIGSLVMLALLLFARNRFTVRFDPHRLVTGIRLAAVTLAVALLWGTVAIYLLDVRDFGREFGFFDSIVRTLRQFVLIGNSDLVPRSSAAAWSLRLLSVLGIVAFSLAAFSLFRPVVYRLTLSPAERRRAWELVARYGRSTYDYFKPWPDKSLHFTSQDSFVGYRVEHGVAVVLGDPVASREELEISITRFIRFADENGWLTAFLMPEESLLYARLGLGLVKVGEEATVDLERFRSVTAHNKYFRKVRRKMEQQQVTFGRHLPPHPSLLLSEAERVSARWIGQKRYREFGFVQGTFGRDYLQRSILDVVRSVEGEMIAFVNEVPSYRPGEASFDMMRRIPEANASVMDYLFLRMMLLLAEEGYRTFNLGLAPFAGVGEDPESSLIEKAIDRVEPYTEWLVRSRGLTEYKMKFQPEWEDRFVAYGGGPLMLPQVALALGSVV